MMQLSIEKRKALWKAMCKAETFNLPEIVRVTDLSHAFCRKYIQELLYDGALKAGSKAGCYTQYSVAFKPRNIPCLVQHKRAGVTLDKEGAWAAIRTLKSFTVDDICNRTKMHRASVRRYVMSLTKSEHLKINGRSKDNNAYIFALINDTGRHAPDVSEQGEIKEPSPRQKMWMAIKAIGLFSYKDLSLAAIVPDRTAQNYACDLERFGYLRICHTDPDKQHHYRLIKAKDTGPHAPRPKGRNQMYDPNLRKLIQLESGAA